MNPLRLFLLIPILVFALSSCKKEEPDPQPDPVYGCTDPKSLTFNPAATVSNGSCEYPENYAPQKAGNSWTLNDIVTTLLGDVPVEGLYQQTKDTSINGKSYVLTYEIINGQVPVIGAYNQTTIYAYRMDSSTGKVWRWNISNGDTTEKLFLDHPLDMGKVWYDTPEQDGFKFKITGINVVTVPAGTFNNCLQLEITDLATSLVSILYLAKEVGPVKAEINVEVPLAGSITIRPELTSYHVQ